MANVRRLLVDREDSRAYGVDSVDVEVERCFSGGDSLK